MNDVRLETIKKFPYLGNIVSNDGGTTKYLKENKQSMRSLCQNETKIRIFNCIVNPVLLYDSQIGLVTKATRKKL